MNQCYCFIKDVSHFNDEILLLFQQNAKRVRHTSQILNEFSEKNALIKLIFLKYENNLE